MGLLSEVLIQKISFSFVSMVFMEVYFVIKLFISTKSRIFLVRILTFIIIDILNQWCKNYTNANNNKLHTYDLMT